ncbi:MAG: acyl-CoA dehydrogenase C-terminal domain-containing protein [Betaproteobacteria bacterium]|nr:acyl-CoA dehydrogenase C-terminal domain-containing protein [Betaproteobacteria bacterium]MBP6187479.1 acyl-CoA dehydrogenase C-terminal domain-containing protein [Azonexus sp.]MBP6201668.1 acyl-CoA dehydrogenase C-terminal domain-containing protein [Azonexus sp.]
MSTYIAPIRDMQFVLNEVAGLSDICALPGNEECSVDLVESILDEASKFATGVLDPINKVGDQIGHVCKDGVVTTAPGFKEAYKLFAETGWNSMPFDPEYGGQGLPAVVSMAVNEMWKGANMAFGLCPMLTGGAIEAIAHHASDELKQIYLPKMIEGTWTGTMNLTEPNAGSDLAAISSKAKAVGDGSYLVSGTKIFITWGEHDVAENIIHLVLARLPDAPPGLKGISLFLVPKFLVNADGSLGKRNDLICASIEHKLGIHGSPTAVMSYGENEGAVGYLIGDENKGIGYMFTMMNHARVNVGLEGVGIAERAYQHALWYARERVQGKIIGDNSGEKKTILHHPDVRRMLMDVKSRTEAMRTLAYYSAANIDRAHAGDAAAQSRVDLLTPVVKGWSTEQGVELSSTALQVFGGVGFVEETGAAQYYRDSRITTIYEGTTAIQANDLVGRKLAREKVPGAAMKTLIAEMSATAEEIAGDAQLATIAVNLKNGINSLSTAADWILANYDSAPAAVHAGSVPFLKLTGIVVGGWLMAKSAAIAVKHLAEGTTDDFYKAKLATATYFAAHQIPFAAAYAAEIIGGSDSVFALPENLF